MEIETRWGMIEVVWDYIIEPDTAVGEHTPYVNGWWITHVGNRPCSRKVSAWLMERLDHERIETRIVEENW